jgi:hypothetical protein
VMTAVLPARRWLETGIKGPSESGFLRLSQGWAGRGTALWV